MERKAIKLLESPDGKRAIYVDFENYQSILDYINSDARHKKKFKFIAEHILNGRRNTEVYDKEEINDNCKGVTAMKLFKGQENDRIYCKQETINSKTFVVVAVELLERKKSKKLGHQEIAIITRVASYQYYYED